VETKSLSQVTAPPLAEEPGLGALTLPGFLAEIAQQHGPREALCWLDLEGTRKTFTYAQFAAEAHKVASALLASGVGRNTRVGLLASNRPEWLFSLFGIAMAGGVTVALNTFSTPRELEHQLKIADVEVLIIEAGVASQNFIDDIFTLCPVLADGAPGNLFTVEFPFLRRVVCIDTGYGRPGLQEWDDFIAGGTCIPAATVDAVARLTSPVDQGMIFFSSGSTAEAKAILQTHRAATLQFWRFGRINEVDCHTRSLPVNGFFFSGSFAQAMGTICQGGCMILVRTFEPEAVLSMLQAEKITCLVAWPHQEARLQECGDWEQTDLSTLRCVSFNSVLRSHPTVNTHWRGWQGHGMTETFTLISVTYGDDFREGSFGSVLPGNTVRIVDPESGEVLPLGKTGEIIVKGPTTMLGYLTVPPEATFDAEGFIHTADAGHLGEDGHLYWEGRLSEIIKTGGANVSPTEIDEVLAEHAGILRCCTVGIPDEDLGEKVLSCVVLREGHTLTEDEVRAFGKRYLSSYKVPRRVLFMREVDFPKTGSDKVRRSELRAIAEQRLAAEQA